ncbi:MFS transporter [Yinghuangia seranimata]|uniref:MFS transporter n=1 Tax=Yinghuangia seranimata TaxID=408067 RepID=UPI00248AF779|nr:MFS transporter [Yinghuangia seranimata]MDI2125237.1 MFS transporter [Yinghuangia seranimata]
MQRINEPTPGTGVVTQGSTHADDATGTASTTTGAVSAGEHAATHAAGVANTAGAASAGERAPSHSAGAAGPSSTGAAGAAGVSEHAGTYVTGAPGTTGMGKHVPSPAASTTTGAASAGEHAPSLTDDAASTARTAGAGAGAAAGGHGADHAGNAVGEHTAGAREPGLSEPLPRTRWAAVVAVAFGTFAVVTTEMLPVGLLTPIATGLDVSDGTAGIAMTVCGIVATVAAPVLTVAVGRLDRRVVLVAMTALLLASNVLSALAPNFGLFLVARVLVGLSVGGFWAIGAGIAGRLAAPEDVGRASAVVFGGVAVASVLGVPVGTLVGARWGWRWAFGAMAGFALVVLVVLLFVLPKLTAQAALRAGDFPKVLRERPARVALLALLLLVGGHFAAYTYVRPVLEDLAGLGAGAVGVVLVGYGLAGVVGNFTLGVAAAGRLRVTAVRAFALVAGSVLVLPVAGVWAPAAVALILVWGVGYGAVPVSLQVWMAQSTPKAPEAGSAVFVTAFQIAISMGSVAGGLVADHVAVRAALFLGGGLALAALACVFAGLTRRIPEGSLNRV